MINSVHLCSLLKEEIQSNIEKRAKSYTCIICESRRSIRRTKKDGKFAMHYFLLSEFVDNETLCCRHVRGI